MNRTNTLINGDVKGWASYKMEKSLGADFVAGFGSTNLGDISPNLDGAKCRYEGNPPRGVEEGSECNQEHSTCPSDAFGNMSPEFCIGHGLGLGLAVRRKGAEGREERARRGRGRRRLAVPGQLARGGGVFRSAECGARVKRTTTTDVP